MFDAIQLRPPACEGESVADHMIRLLQVNGDAWISPNREAGRVLKGGFRRETAATSMAALGIPPADGLLAHTPIAVPRPRHVEIAGEIIHRDSWTVSRRRWCPACWADDLARPPEGRLPFWNVHRRFWWGITSVETCPIHRVRLRETCPACDGAVRWTVGRMLSCGQGHDLLACAADPLDREDVLADAYVVGRLGAAPRVSVPLLDGIPLADAVDVMQRLGAAAVDGPFGSFAKLPAERRPAAMSAGFRIARDWPGAFADLVADMAKAFGPGNWGAQNLYGYLYDWVRRLPKTPFGEEMRRTFFGEIARHGFLVERALAIKYAPRTFVTVRTAARAIGCAHETTRRYLEELGYRSPGSQKGTPVNIPLKAVDDLRALFRDRLNAQETALRLGVGADTVLTLRREGLLRPDPVHERCNRNDWYFMVADIDALLARLKGHAPTVDAIPDGMAELPRASQMAGAGRTVGVCRLILNGWLRPVAILESGVGLRAILTSAAAIREAIRRAAGRRHSYREAAAILGLHPESVRALAGAGLLRDCLLPDGSIAVSDESLAAFPATYVTSRELAAGIGTTSRYVTVLLRQAGVRPVADPESLKGYRGSLYRRGDVPGNLAAQWEAAFPGRKGKDSRRSNPGTDGSPPQA